MRDDEFEWHDAKAKLNAREHRISFEFARLAFQDPRFIERLDPDESDEDRISAMSSAGSVSALSLRGRQPNVSKTSTTARTRRRKAGVTSRAGKYGMTPEMWAKLKAMTDEEVLAAARRDPDNRPLEDRDPASLTPARHLSIAKRIRWGLRMSQAEFAKTFHIPLATLREWEYHLREPDEPARAYLEVIAREPDVVRRALRRKTKKAASTKAKKAA